ncbi:MAG TPA: heparan-alpha-glucosaminide N-acetyltransferase domain-containing protein, partial [Chryseolinea sp.]|nr:heparan-alpha-glucosaminide N-acetyltransferase domain-containing protein [Chryseolinea sp.]
SIDIVRGFIMIIMALDHVREFFSYTPYRPDDVTQASVFLFFTRWITHLCAPSFIFLSGISIYLYFKKVGSKKKTSMFLVTRGLWLIAVEILVISFILTQGYQLTLLAVIWTIGCSMILLAALVWLPRWLQITLSLAMIVGHDALPMFDKVSSDNMLFALLHNPPFFINEPPILVAYTIVPWVGVMLLGYVIGSWFFYPPQTRDKFLLRTGIFALVLFFVLRFLNIYGEPSPWSIQERGGIFTLLSFFKISKSPPSLLFLCVTLGIACILLARAERISASAKEFLSTYGRVPFFYFIVHLAIISLTSFLWTYFSFGKGVNLSFMPAGDWPVEYHPSLLRTYFVWLLLISTLYFPCRWYGNYEAKSKTWWVSYL